MLKPVFIEGRDLDDTWFQLLAALHEHGRRYKITDGSYAGAERVAFDFVSGFIHHPHSRPLAPRLPESSPLPRPTTDDEIENYFVNYLMNSELEKNEDYRYATWIVGGEYQAPAFVSKYQIDGDRHFYGSNSLVIAVPNQIEWIIDHFKTKGLGNEHCYLSVGYPESNFAYDLPYDNPNDRRTSPCLRGLDFRVVDGKLLTHVIYRSWDLWGGWPTNMGGFTMLNQYVAEEIGVEPGPLAFSSKSLHCYDFQLEVLKARLGK